MQKRLEFFRDLPLHPAKVSIPMTCQPKRPCRPISSEPHNDWMCYILYHDDVSFLRQIIATSVKAIARSHNSSPSLDVPLEWFMDTQSDSPHMLRAKLIVLLDQDETTRREFTAFQSETCRLRRPLPPLKADRFYEQLHVTVIPQWICNERVSLDTFIDNARMAYLIS